MKKATHFLTATVILFASTSIFAQQHKCGQHIATKQFLQNNPHLVKDIEATEKQLEDQTQQYIQENKNSRSATVKVIPVVFHILHNNGPENIGDAQIKNSLKILNEDFNKQNSDLSEAASAFQSIVGDVEFQFKLAKKDPNGNCTNGIIRWQTTQTFNADDNIKAGKIWPRDKYMNLFIVDNINLGGNVAGYTYIPSTVDGNPGNDAIIVEHPYLGDIGTASANDGRTLTHEVGHWFNLSHTWGPTNDPNIGSNCSSDDGVSDTPNTIGQAFGCNLSTSSCSSLDNVQNYMNYASCPMMFTAGQALRMQAAASNSVAQRNNLSTSSNLQATGLESYTTICNVDFIASDTAICAGTTIDFFDISSGGYNQWKWTTNGGVPGTSTVEDPEVTYYTGGLYDVKLKVTNTSTNSQKTKTSYMAVYPIPGQYLPFTEDFENDDIPGGYWVPDNPDHSSNSWVMETSTGFSGTRCLKMVNYFNTDGETDEVLGPTYDLSTLTAATLKFKVAFAQRFASNNDNLFLFGSANCGTSWQYMWNESGATLSTLSPQTSAFTPSSGNDWKEVTVNVNASMLKENFRPKFRLIADGGNNLYIDDINITGTFNPVPILYWPKTGTLNTAEDITIDWKAVGSGIDNYEYQIDINPAFNTGNLIAGTKSFISNDPNNSDTEFDATNLTHGQKYYWRVRTFSGSTPSQWSDVWDFTVSANGVGVEDEEEEKTDLRVYPNPTLNEAFIEFNLMQTSTVSLKIYDVLGKEVATITDSEMAQGGYKFSVDKSILKQGIYLIRVNINNKSETRKLIVK